MRLDKGVLDDGAENVVNIGPIHLNRRSQRCGAKHE